MGMNAVYQGPDDLPAVIPVFPLPGALLLPRGQMPLNIFEPRYLAMIDDALPGDRIIGMIQPDDGGGRQRARAEPLSGRLRRPDHLVRRDRRRPLPDHAHRHRPLRGRRGAVARRRSIRQCRVSVRRLSRPISSPARARTQVDRAGVVKTLPRLSRGATISRSTGRASRRASNETLVNALAMMAPSARARSRRCSRRPTSAPAPRCWSRSPRCRSPATAAARDTPLQ